MASNYDGNKGVNGNGLLYFIGKVKTWIDTYFLKKNLGSSKASKVVVTDSSGNVDVSTITPTELGYLSGMNQNIHTALGNKANQTDLTDLGNGFTTFVNTTAPATYQKKMTIGGGTAGAVTTVRANGNFIITISQDGKTVAFSVPEADSSIKGVVAVGLGKLGGVDEEDGYFDCFGVDETDGYKLKAPAVNTTRAGVMTPYMYNKLAGIEAEANKYVLPQATTTTLGGVKVPYTNTGSVTPQAKSTTADRYYGVELDTRGLAVVNVPWTDTKMSNKSYTAGTDTKVVVGTKITGNNTLAELTAGTGISITGTTSAITIANTYSYTLPQATDSTLGGVKVAGVVTGSDQQGLNYVVKIASGGTDDGKLGIETASTSHAGVMSPTMVTTLNNALPASAVKNTEQSGSAASTDVVYRCDYINTAMGSKAPLASPALTGTPTAPTAATSTNTTQIATTAFVHAAIENADIGGKTYQGNIASEAALKTIKTFKQGQYFTVSAAFTFADGSWALGIGDMLFVKENYTWASGNVDGSKFAAVQGNNDYLTNSELDAIFTEVFGSAA